MSLRQTLSRSTLVALCLGGPVVLSCTKPAATPVTTSVSSANASPIPPAGRRVPPPRDSQAKLRAIYVAQVMKQIAGRENEPAEVVFKNIQVLKGMTAAALVRRMDEEYGAAMSWNCTN